MIEELDFDTGFIVDEIEDDIIPIVDISEIIDIEEDITAPKKKRIKTKKNYINNSDFYQAITSHIRNCEVAALNNIPEPKMPDYIGKCWLKLAENYAKKPNFYRYPTKHEMIGDGIENCLRYWKKFKPEYKNPFAYFTSVIHNAFVRRIRLEKIEQYVRYKTADTFLLLDEAEFMDSSDGNMEQCDVYSNVKDFIQKFEESEYKRNEKQKMKLAEVNSRKYKEPKGLEQFYE